MGEDYNLLIEEENCYETETKINQIISVHLERSVL